MHRIVWHACQLARQKRGNVALIMALLAPFLLGVTALATDYVLVYSHASKLQDAADAAALSGARELGVAGNDDDEVKAITADYANSNFYRGSGEATLDSQLEIETEIHDGFGRGGTRKILAQSVRRSVLQHFPHGSLQARQLGHKG